MDYIFNISIISLSQTGISGEQHTRLPAECGSRERQWGWLSATHTKCPPSPSQPHPQPRHLPDDCQTCKSDVSLLLLPPYLHHITLTLCAVASQHFNNIMSMRLLSAAALGRVTLTETECLC